MPRAACLANSHHDDTGVENNGIIAYPFIKMKKRGRQMAGGGRKFIGSICSGRYGLGKFLLYTGTATQNPVLSLCIHLCTTYNVLVPDLRTSSIADSA